jgi:hypothetical protein
LCCSVLLPLICSFWIVVVFLFMVHVLATEHWNMEWTWMISVLILWYLTQYISHVSNLAIFEINFMAMYSFIGLFTCYFDAGLLILILFLFPEGKQTWLLFLWLEVTTAISSCQRWIIFNPW